MKTRIHIHRELITVAGEIKHFVVKLPPDCVRVSGLKATATPVVGETSLRHIEVGNLRLTRDGMLLYETQVRYEAKLPGIGQIAPPGLIEQSSMKVLSGGKTEFETVLLDGRSTSLLAKFSGHPSLFNFEVSVYVRYQSKTKKR